MIEHELPEGWQIKTLGETCSKGQYGYTTSANDNGNIRLLRTTDISKYYLNWDSVPFCEENPTEIDKYLLQDNDVLISRAGSVGYSYLIKTPPYKTVFASYLIRFKPYMSILFPEYLILYLKSNYYWQQITDMSAGVALANINATKLQKLKIIIPPLNIQYQIVAKVGQLFGELDDGVNILQTLKQQVKVFRQSVLKAAFSGKLTGSYASDDELPIGWQIKRMGDVMNLAQGLAINAKTKHLLTDNGIPLLRITDLLQGRIKQYVDEVNAPLKCIVNSSELIYTRTGHVGLVFRNKCGVLHNNCFKLMFDNTYISKDYLYWFLSQDVIRNIAFNKAGGSTQKDLKHDSFRSMEMILCPLKEQNQIVTKIEELFAICDELDQTIDNALNQSQLLRQSILKQAFSDKLI